MTKLNFWSLQPAKSSAKYQIYRQGRWSVDISKWWSTKKLGVLFDSTCCLDAHIGKLCRSINFNLYSVGKIRKYLDGSAAERWLMPPKHLAWITVAAYYMECCQNMQPGLKCLNWTILALCWENCIGFPWSMGSVTKFSSSPTRHWTVMLHNIWQH